MAKKRKPTVSGRKAKTGKLSLYPLSVEDALRAAAQTGPAPGKPKKKTRRS